MPSLALSAELTREHREIDDAIETFTEKLDCGSLQHELPTETLEALRRHIYLEEVFLFPPLREAGIVMPIFVMNALAVLADGGLPEPGVIADYAQGDREST